MLAVSFVVACGDDGKEPAAPNPPVTTEDPVGMDIVEAKTPNQWIDRYLSEWYLWPDDIKAKTRDNDLRYDKFFESLLSKNREDGKWSNGSGYFYSYMGREDMATVRSRADQEGELSIGFRYAGMYYDASRTRIVLVVLYVIPGSDAEAKGLKRGDMIGAIDGQNITPSNYSDMVDKILNSSHGGTMGTASLSFTIMRFNDANKIYEVETPAVVTPAIILESPVLLSESIESEGRKVGYLAYNSFTTGYPDMEDYRFDDQLKEAFAKFKQWGVSDLILDLRYNRGGALISARLLTSMIIPEAKNQDVFIMTDYNDYIKQKYFSGQSSTSKFLTVSQMSNSASFAVSSKPGVNLSLNRVFVIATSTSASASELVINSLRGIGVEVIVVGTTTEGKGVGMTRIKNGNVPMTNKGEYLDATDGKTYRYYMWPITFAYKNAVGQGVPSTGITPTHSFEEFQYLPLWKEMGDPEDPLLLVTLEKVFGTRSSRMPEMEPSGEFIKIDVPYNSQNEGVKEVIDIEALSKKK